MKVSKMNQRILSNTSNCKDMSEIVNMTAKRSPNKIFIFNLEDKKKISYKKFNELLNKCCNFFIKKVNPKDILTIKIKNSLEFLVIYFASLRYKSIINQFRVVFQTLSFKKKLNFKTKINICR